VAERAKLISIDDPRIKITANTLRSIYRKTKIRKKRVIKVAANPRKYTPEVLEEMLNDLKYKLVNLDEAGYEIFQLDESIFSG
jgi:ABC-type Zn2+ transport system substrate-binding protein/surface adhesin